ncbi:radical SAM family heme chaperone HemW [Flavobacteriales bacterium]|nr:radical SAM family heme chaperone HemW [Flavobacteriales bacterium]
MAGIYIHIPFCDKACHYCDFHFSTTFASYRKELIDCLLEELRIREKELEGEVQTIYFGGGTPSVLTLDEWKQFTDYFKLRGYFEKLKEFTVEVNPDHLDPDYLQGLKDFGVNRLSIGVQSFHDEVLQKMNRSHDREKALAGLKAAKKMGFDNITLDLIYGVPFQTVEELKENLAIIEFLDIPHISAYQLTIENDTVFGKWKQQGKLLELSDESCLEQFKRVRNSLLSLGYEHYEVSNFAKSGRRSIHNSSYWRQIKYVGIGPGAHSFDGSNRAWNINNNKQYIKSIQEGKLSSETELLETKDQFNEAILLGLRQLTSGVDIDRMEKLFPNQWNSVQGEVKHFINQGDLKTEHGFLKLTDEGIFIIDYISSELFVSA